MKSASRGAGGVTTQRFGRLLGESQAMKRVLDLIARVADSDASVLITGESGTGKELIARAIHSPASQAGPFLAVNCAAIPPRCSRASSSATRAAPSPTPSAPRTGLFVQAERGNALPRRDRRAPDRDAAQAPARAAGAHGRPVGANDRGSVRRPHRHRDQPRSRGEVDEKRFREDLYYRINVVSVDAPALARAREATCSSSRSTSSSGSPRAQQQGRAALDAAAAEKLVAYDWPGNVRELENCIERAVALLRFDEVTVDDLPEKSGPTAPSASSCSADDPAEVITIDELERRYILRVLSLAGGNKSRAAQLLGSTGALSIGSSSDMTLPIAPRARRTRALPEWCLPSSDIVCLRRLQTPCRHPRTTPTRIRVLEATSRATAWGKLPRETAPSVSFGSPGSEPERETGHGTNRARHRPSPAVVRKR